MTQTNRIKVFLLAVIASSSLVSAQQNRTAVPVRVDSQALRNAGTATDTMPGSWLSFESQ